MKTITNKRYGESYVEETLENGLHVVLWQKPDYEKSLFMMATPLGAMDMKQVDEHGRELHFPAGIAHFWSIRCLKWATVMLWSCFPAWVPV